MGVFSTAHNTELKGNLLHCCLQNHFAAFLKIKGSGRLKTLWSNLATPIATGLCCCIITSVYTAADMSRLFPLTVCVLSRFIMVGYCDYELMLVDIIPGENYVILHNSVDLQAYTNTVLNEYLTYSPIFLYTHIKAGATELLYWEVQRDFHSPMCPFYS